MMGIATIILLLFGMLMRALPIIIIFLILHFATKPKNNKTASYSSSEASVALDQPIVRQSPTVPDKQPPSGRWLNILLYIGSFLILIATFFFVSQASIKGGIEAAVLIFTVAFFGVGLILHHSAPYLRPSALALIWTGLLMTFFWAPVLISLGLSDAVSACIAYLFQTIMSLFAIFQIKDYRFSYLFFFGLTLFLESLIISCGLGSDGLYAMLVAPIISLILSYFVTNKSQRFPQLLRKASYHYTIFAPIAVGAIALSNSVVTFGRLSIYASDAGNSNYFFSTLTFIIIALQYFYSWIKNRSHRQEVILRILLSFFLLALTLDCLACTGVYGTSAQTSFIFILLVISCAQALFSFFRLSRVKNLDADRRATRVNGETVTVLVSILGIFFVYLFGFRLGTDIDRFMRLIVLSMMIAIGPIGVYASKALRWSIISLIGLFLLFPTVANLIDFSFNPSAIQLLAFTYYFIFGVAMLLFHEFFRKSHPKNSLIITMATMVICLIIASVCVDKIYLFIVWGVYAFAFYILSLRCRLSKEGTHRLKELSIYAAAIALCLLMSNIVFPALSSDVGGYLCDVAPCPSSREIGIFQAEALEIFVNGIIISLSLIITSYLYERNFQTKVRLAIAYAIASCVCLASSNSGYAYGNGYAHIILSLLTQVALLILGVMKTMKTLSIISAIFVVVYSLALTSGNGWLWLAVLGIGLIAFVIWQYRRLNKT